MTRFVWAFFAVIAGVLMGLAMTASAVSTPPQMGSIKAGVWVVRPKVGTPDADPYAKAMLAVRGEIPVSAAEGIGLEAQRDNAGHLLDSTCDYRFSGPMPTARYWSLTAYTPEGMVIDTPVRRATFTSSEMLRPENGVNFLLLSAEARDGNWMPLRAFGAFRLILRLYDTPLSANALALDAASLPTLARENCR